MFRKLHHRRCSLLIALLASSLSAGCSMCTEVGCGDQFALELTSPDENFAAGEYRVEGTDGERTYRCDFTVSYDKSKCDTLPCVTSDGWCATNYKDPSKTIRVMPVSETPGPSKPDHLEVTISVDESLHSEHSISLNYEPMYPNGESCGAECVSATAVIVLSP